MRQAQVQHHELGAQAPRLAQGREAVAHARRLEARAVKRDSQDLADQRVVVHDQDQDPPPAFRASA